MNGDTGNMEMVFNLKIELDVDAIRYVLNICEKLDVTGPQYIRSKCGDAIEEKLEDIANIIRDMIYREMTEDEKNKDSLMLRW